MFLLRESKWKHLFRLEVYQYFVYISLILYVQAQDTSPPTPLPSALPTSLPSSLPTGQPTVLSYGNFSYLSFESSSKIVGARNVDFIIELGLDYALPIDGSIEITFPSSYNMSKILESTTSNFQSLSGDFDGTVSVSVDSKSPLFTKFVPVFTGI